MARYARTPPSLSRYCGRNPPYCLSNGRKPGAPPVGAYCSLAGVPDTRYQILFFSRTSTRYHLSLVTGSICTVLPCLGSPSLPLQNLKSGHNIYIPTMDFLWSGHKRGRKGVGYRVVELCGWSSLARSGHCALWLSGHPRECLVAPDVATSAATWAESATIVTLMRGGGTRWEALSSSSSWSLVSRTLR